MSSARKRGAIQKAVNETDRVRQSLILSEYHGALMKGFAEALATDAARYRWLVERHDSEDRESLWHVRDDTGQPVKAGELSAAIDAAMDSYNAEAHREAACGRSGGAECYAATTTRIEK